MPCAGRVARARGVKQLSDRMPSRRLTAAACARAGTPQGVEEEGDVKFEKQYNKQRDSKVRRPPPPPPPRSVPCCASTPPTTLSPPAPPPRL